MNEQQDPVLAELGELLATHYAEIAGRDAVSAKSGRDDRPEVAFGRYLRAARRVLNLTLADVAQRTEISESEILAYERGLIPKRHIKTAALRVLAEAYNDDVNRFLTLLNVNLVTRSVQRPENHLWRWLTYRLAQYAPDIRLVRPQHLWKPLALVLALLCISLGYRGSTGAGMVQPQPAATPPSVNLTWDGQSPVITTIAIGGEMVASQAIHLLSRLRATEAQSSTITVTIDNTQILSGIVELALADSAGLAIKSALPPRERPSVKRWPYGYR